MACVVLMVHWRLSLDRCLSAGFGSRRTEYAYLYGAPFDGRIAHIEQHDVTAARFKYQCFMWRDLHRHQLDHSPLIAFCNHIMHLCLAAHRATDSRELYRLVTVVHQIAIGSCHLSPGWHGAYPCVLPVQCLI